MRQKKLLSVVLVSMVLMAACAKHVTAPVPNAINTFDSTIYSSLMVSQAGINSIKADIASGKLVATPAIKMALNQAITDYNTANALWQAYHASAGTTPQAPVQAAADKLNADVAAISGGGK